MDRQMEGDQSITNYSCGLGYATMEFTTPIGGSVGFVCVEIRRKRPNVVRHLRAVNIAVTSLEVNDCGE